MSSDDVADFIEAEREISRYKISFLKRTGSSKNRDQLHIEGLVLSTPFESIEWSATQEARIGIELFRRSIEDFSKKYPNICIEMDQKADCISESGRVVILRKRAFIENLYLYLLEIQIQEVNSVQDPYFYELTLSKSKSKDTDLKSMDIDGVLKIETAYVSKCRARAQAIIYSMGRYSFVKLREFKSKFEEITDENAKSAESALDAIISGLESSGYLYFNEGLTEVSKLIVDTMGENNMISSISPLVNLCEEFPNFEFSVNKIQPPGSEIFNFNSLAPKKKLANARAFALITPVKRPGNEYINLMSKKILHKNGDDISHLFEDSLFNVKAGNVYYKALSCRPIWDILSESIYDAKLILNVENEATERDLKMIANSISGCRVDLSQKGSKLLVPKTRSESLHFVQMDAWKSNVIQKINDEYNYANKVRTIDRTERLGSRKGFITELLSSAKY
jgi:hypothetical protein